MKVEAAARRCCKSASMIEGQQRGEGRSAEGRDEGRLVRDGRGEVIELRVMQGDAAE